MFGYNTNNLYIGFLGIVREDDFCNCRIDKIDYVIAFNMKKMEYGDRKAIDVITGKTYYFLKGNRFESDTIDKAINSYAINHFYPIEKYLIQPTKKIKKDALIELLNSFNHLEVKKENKEEVKDNILQAIISTNEFVKQSKISEEIKQSLYSELEKMAEDYANEIIDYHKSTKTSPFKSEYEIWMKYIKLLANIELTCTDETNTKVYSLTKQLSTVREELKK